MRPLEWSADYETGIPIIDEQHKELFRIANESLDLLLKSQDIDVTPEILKELESLEKYAQYHFKTEESLLDKYAYPDKSGHIEEHQTFIMTIGNMKKSAPSSSSSSQQLVELLEFMLSWIANHISDVDSRYKDHIKSQLK